MSLYYISHQHDHRKKSAEAAPEAAKSPAPKHGTSGSASSVSSSKVGAGTAELNTLGTLLGVSAEKPSAQFFRVSLFDDQAQGDASVCIMAIEGHSMKTEQQEVRVTFVAQIYTNASENGGVFLAPLDEVGNMIVNNVQTPSKHRAAHPQALK